MSVKAGLRVEMACPKLKNKWLVYEKVIHPTLGVRTFFGNETEVADAKAAWLSTADEPPK